MESQLISYIALAAPATRRPARGDEPFLRPEIGFTPKWFRDALGIDFGERWHTNPAYRRQEIPRMARQVRQRFAQTNIGWLDSSDAVTDLLTGTFGACTVAGIYGVPVVYASDNWPNCVHQYLTTDDVTRLEPPNLHANPFFEALMSQVDWIADELGCVKGYINWQGVLNNAYRVRGEELFLDIAVEPERARHLFQCVTTTMIEAAQRLYARQRQTGFDVRHFTVSNCLVNMISAQSYRELLLPFDQQLAERFGRIGIHNCAWNADPYVPHYAEIANVGYIDMGIDSDLVAAKAIFPDARRAIMISPTDLANKPLDAIRADLERIAREYAPCDLVFADIESGTPDERILEVIALCQEFSQHVR